VGVCVCVCVCVCERGREGGQRVRLAGGNSCVCVCVYECMCIQLCTWGGWVVCTALKREKE
jgi:hypothetical protein